MTETPPTVVDDTLTKGETIIADDELSNDVSSNGASPFDELRRLILEPEQKQLQHLEDRLDTLPPVPAKEVGEVLSDAVSLSKKKDKALIQTMQSVVEEDIRLSVQRNPQVMADALFPVIGPAIRKAISEALGAMIQSMNQTLEHSFSPQGLRWRMEAWRTGKSFGEVVLLNTLVYKVEQVFLIHKETGLLLQHVVAGSGGIQDADMVSGMLTAIQDFVHDSFTSTESNNSSALDTIHVQDLTVWVEQGPKGVIAGVIRGTPPQESRQVFQTALENIHVEMGEELDTFEGNADVFERCRPRLEECLLMQYSQPVKKAKKISPFQILVGALAVLLLVFGFFYVRHYLRWQNYLETLRKTPGIVITNEVRGWFSDSISGLRDPLAVDPVTLLSESKLTESKVASSWQSFISLDPTMVVARSKEILKSPSTVDFVFDKGTLRASGTASPEWIQQAQRFSSALPGVTKLDLSGLGPTELERLKNKIEDTIIRFEQDTDKLAPEQDEVLDELVGDVEKLFAITTAEGRTVQLEIIGRADSRGTNQANIEISHRRADLVSRELVKLSPQLTLKKIAAGNTQPLKSEITAQDMEVNRSVTIKVIFN